MSVAVDASPFREIYKSALKNALGAYLILNPLAIKAAFQRDATRVNTREVKLETLGVFPLAPESLPLLKEAYTYGSVELTIPIILAKSQIPIFADARGEICFIPPEAARICRYFDELWQISPDEREPHSDESVLAGFAILASYAGL